WSEPDVGIGGMPRSVGIADRFRAYLQRCEQDKGVDLLKRTLEYGVTTLGFDPDAVVWELVDGMNGDNYPVPDRMLVHAEQIDQSEVAADGRHTWQYPDSEIDKLADPKIKAFFVVNPANPGAVAIRESTLRRVADLVAKRRPDLLILTDDVYGTFVDRFQSFA